MTSALDKAYAKQAAQEARLEAADAKVLAALEAPSADLAQRFGEATMKIRSRTGRMHMDRAANSLRTALQHLEAMQDGGAE